MRPFSRYLLALLTAGLYLLSPAASFAGHTKTGTYPVHPPVLKTRTAKADTYFIEFLARPTENFGHAYVRLGSAKGKRETATAIAGLYPDPKRAKSVFDAPGATGYTAPDLTERPTARYRVAVSRRTHDKAKRYMASLRQTHTRYDLFTENCNHVTADLADRLGLKTAGEPNDLPGNNVNAMKTLNGGRGRASWRSKH